MAQNSLDIFEQRVKALTAPQEKPQSTEAPQQKPDRYDQYEKARAVAAAKRAEMPSGIVDAAKDIVASGATGFGRGVAMIPGIIGDVSQLVQRAPSYGAWLAEQTNAGLQGRKSTAGQAYEKKAAEIEAKMTPEERAGMVGQVAGINFPTGQATAEMAEEYVPALGYQPKTRLGKIARTAGEFVGAGVPVTKPLTLARAFTAPRQVGLPLAKEAVTAAGAGAGSEIGRQAAEGTKAEMPAAIFGALPGALFGRGVAGRLPGAAKERGERLAKDIISSTGVKEADIPQQPSGLLPDVKPTTTQLMRDQSELQGLERRMGDVFGETPERAALLKQQEESRDILLGESGKIGETAQRQMPYASMSEAVGLPPSMNAMGDASKRAHDAFRAVEEPLFNAQNAIWKNPAFQNATYSRNSVIKSIDDAIAKMGISYQGLPTDMKNYLNSLKKYKSDEIPFSEIQKAKSFANELIRDYSIKDKSGPIAITTYLDNLLTDVSNLSPSAAARVPDAPLIFDEARKRTRDYHNIFSTKTTKPLTARHPAGHPEAGEYALQPEQMLDKAFGSSKTALSNYRELKLIPNLDIDGAASDWMVGKLTNNGQKPFVTQDDVQKFLRDPAYAQLANEVPGLRQRIDDIAKQSINEQVAKSFANVMDDPNPDKLYKYIQGNRRDLDMVFTSPAQRQFIDQLERSARTLRSIKSGVYSQNQLFNTLANGDLFTILHGKATGAIAGGVSGYIAGKMIGAAAPVAAGLEIVGGGAGAMGVLPKGREFLSRLVYGTTKDQAVEAINRAMRDPEYMRLLMQKPTIANTMKLRDLFLKKGPVLGAKAAFTASRVAPDIQSEPPKTTEEEYQDLVRQGKIKPKQADGGRVARADGGKVDIERGVRALMMAVDAAKKKVNLSTESLLEQPDEHVAQALSMAKRHI